MESEPELRELMEAREQMEPGELMEPRYLMEPGELMEPRYLIDEVVDVHVEYEVA